MRDQSKAVLNTKLQVEKSSRIQGVPDAIIIDGCVMLWKLHWPTSDIVATMQLQLMIAIFYLMMLMFKMTYVTTLKLMIAQFYKLRLLTLLPMIAQFYIMRESANMT